LSALVIALIAINLILLAERYAFWFLLWSRYQERERRADQMFDRLLGFKGIRPIAQPQLDQSQPRTPVFSQDERDAIQDRIKERLEIATLRNEAITPAQAEAEVWASLGYSQPPNLNGN
jgi:hypothetical protein